MALKILAFFAHPDDETMLAGGVLALLARAGAIVHYLSATRGEGGECGEPPLCSRPELGQVREQELVCAVQALGGRSLTFLDYVDPAVGEGEQLFAYTSDLTLLAGQVAATLRQFEIDAVITHGSDGEYGHPAHVVTHQAARIAVESLAPPTLAPTTLAPPGSGFPAPWLYSASASFPGHPRPRLTNRSDPADYVVDIAEALNRKTAAALCQRTQHALFVRRPSLEAGRSLSVPEVILKLEGIHRAVPRHLPEGSEDPLARVLKPWILDPGSQPVDVQA